jgi:hypothetical protein
MIVGDLVGDLVRRCHDGSSINDRESFSATMDFVMVRPTKMSSDPPDFHNFRPACNPSNASDGHF